MRVLGIDCGSQRTGYGVIESDGADHRMVAAGVICTSPKWPFEKRLLEISTGLRGLKVGPLAVPLSPRKQRELDEFREWFRGWLPAVKRLCAGA